MKTLPDLWRHAEEKYADQPCVWLKQGAELTSLTYAQVGERIRDAACGLLTAGVQPGEMVGLLAENCPEWPVADYALQLVGAVCVPIFPALPAEQVGPQLARVRARLVIVEDHHQLAKLEAARDQLPRFETAYVIDARKLPEDHPFAKPWSALIEAGAARREELLAQVAERSAAVKPEDLATIIFTSGTTGVPKGAMLTHGNFVTNVIASDKRLKIHSTDRLLAFLPLSHVFQRMVNYLGAYCGGSCLYDSNPRGLLPNLKQLKPTVLIVVPRLLSLIRDRVLSGIGEKTGLAGTIAQWALGIGEQVAEAYVAGRELTSWQKMQQQLADKRVFSAVREQLGLDECRFMVSGGAALPPDLARWYYGIGLRVAQGYGLTETSPVVAVNDPEEYLRFEVIGRPIDDVEVRIAADGELLCRGPNIMVGYFEMPEETAAAIDAEGWFHTGDIAAMTDDGFLKITDRKKNIMVLANGKNVAPQPIETAICESPLIDRCMLIGDDQNIVTALIVPNFDALCRRLRADGMALEDGADRAWLATREAERVIRQEIDRLTPHLASFEKVRRFKLLSEDFSAERGELSLKMDLKRKQILANYAELIGSMAE